MREPRRAMEALALALGVAAMANLNTPAMAEQYQVTVVGLAGLDFNQGVGVNATGQVAGSSRIAGGSEHAFLTGANGGGTAIDLGTLGGSLSYASGVNASGQVTGNSNINSSSAYHAFLTAANGGTMRDLGTLGGTFSYGLGVNASGQVVGYSNTTGNAAEHAFMTLAGGISMIDLGTLGGDLSVANAINNKGQVVGQSDATVNGAEHAFLYENGQMFDLNSLIINPIAGYTFTDALGINDAGQITGYFTNANGRSEAVLLSVSTVPEPSSLLMAALGLGGVAVAGKLRTRKRA